MATEDFTKVDLFAKYFDLQKSQIFPKAKFTTYTVLNT
jgi:hypothetical protein